MVMHKPTDKLVIDEASLEEAGYLQILMNNDTLYAVLKCLVCCLKTDGFFLRNKMHQKSGPVDAHCISWKSVGSTNACQP